MQHTNARRNLFSYATHIRCVVVALCFMMSVAGAQDFKKQFKNAKELFESGKYSEALDAFKPLQLYDRNNPYPEYASFYSAVSAYRLGFMTLAKETFAQIRKIYPTWDQMDEVNYWLVRIYFEQREYFRAMALLNNIKSQLLTDELTPVKRKALRGIDDVETLRMMSEEFKTDRDVYYALALALGSKPTDENLRQLDSITSFFGWNRKDFIVAEAPRLKDVYRLALVMPFMTENLDATPGVKISQFVLDLYQGMRLAADSLEVTGVKLQLLAYDTEHKPETIRALIKEPELGSADLIVGPLLSDDARPLQLFADEKKIPIAVNPLSANGDLVRGNTTTFLFQPSYATIGKKSAEWLGSRVRNKKCMIFSGETSRDSALAISFAKEAAANGLRVVYSERVTAEKSTELLAKLATPTKFDEWKNPKQFKMKLDSIGSIFVATEDPLIYSKVINAVEMRGDSIIVIGQESWLDDASVDPAKFEHTGTIFTMPNYTPIEGAPFQNFRRNYLRRHGVIPSVYARMGYEFTWIIGQAMGKYGVNFTDGLTRERWQGVLTPGYQMQDGRDSAVVPFVKFKDGRLVLLEVR